MRSIKHLLIISVALVTALNCVAEVKIEEKVVGPAFGPGVVYTLSPKGMHVATAHGRDGKTLVTVYGVDGPLIDRIFDGAAFGIVVKYSEDGYYTRTEQKWTGPVAFSPNAIGTRGAMCSLARISQRRRRKMNCSLVSVTRCSCAK